MNGGEKLQGGDSTVEINCKVEISDGYTGWRWLVEIIGRVAI